MTEREMLVVDSELIRRIDENRGDLSRGRFVEFCVSRHIDEMRPAWKQQAPQAREAYASRGEFDEVRHSVRSSLSALVELLIDRLGEGRHREYHSDETLSEGKPTAETEATRSRSQYPGSSSEHSGDDEAGKSEAHHPATCSSYQQASCVPVEALKQRLREVLEEDGRLQYHRRSADAGHSAATYGETARPHTQVEGRNEGEQDYYDLPRAITNAARSLKGRLSEMLGLGKSTESSKETSSRPRVHEERINSSHENGGQNMYLSLWIPAILLFGFGDTLLSTMVFAKGGYEANPLMGSVVSLFGGSLFAFVMIKTVAVVVLALISFKVFRHVGWLIPSVLCAVGTYLVLSNLIAYLSL